MGDEKRPAVRTLLLFVFRPAFASFRLPTAFELALPGPIPCKLPCHAATARAARQRPLQCGLMCLFGMRAGRLEMIEPHRDDPEIVVLIERIERHPQPETLGERHLFLGGFAGMDFLADMLVFEVFV